MYKEVVLVEKEAVHRPPTEGLPLHFNGINIMDGDMSYNNDKRNSIIRWMLKKWTTVCWIEIKDNSVEKTVTHPSKPINPSRYSFPSQSAWDIIRKMITVLGNKMIGISMIFRGNSFNKHSEFRGRHIKFSQRDRTSVYKTRTAPWFYFKNSTSREVVSSKSILFTMDCVQHDRHLNEFTYLGFQKHNNIELTILSL